MRSDDCIKRLRAYWWLVPAALLLAVLGYVTYHSGRDPAELLREYGYLVILIWTFLEGETIVIIAGWLSASVGLTPWLIALCAFGGSFASDQVMFSLGKYKGEAILGRFPRIARNMDKASRLFKKYDTALILGFRFIYGVRNITPIMLGISGVSHKKFFCLNLIGAAVWALAFTYGGYYAGKAFMHVMHQVGHGIFYVILGLLAAAGLLWFIRAHHNVKRAKNVAAASRTDGEKEKDGPDGCAADAPDGCAADMEDAPATAGTAGPRTGGPDETAGSGTAPNPAGQAPSDTSEKTAPDASGK